jgi:hypothetical protein
MIGSSLIDHHGVNINPGRVGCITDAILVPVSWRKSMGSRLLYSCDTIVQGFVLSHTETSIMGAAVYSNLISSIVNK